MAPSIDAGREPVRATYSTEGDTVHIFKNDARLRKPFRCCSAFPLLMQLGRHKRSYGRRKRSPGRSVSEAASRFGNLCVFKPSVLQKKPSASSEETFDSRKKPSNLRKKPFNLRRVLRRKRISEKRSECRRHFFFDAYRRPVVYECYECVQAVFNSIHIQHYPKTWHTTWSLLLYHLSCTREDDQLLLNAACICAPIHQKTTNLVFERAADAGILR